MAGLSAIVWFRRGQRQAVLGIGWEGIGTDTENTVGWPSLSVEQGGGSLTCYSMVFSTRIMLVIKVYSPGHPWSLSPWGTCLVVVPQTKCGSQGKESWLLWCLCVGEMYQIALHFHTTGSFTVALAVQLPVSLTWLSQAWNICRSLQNLWFHKKDFTRFEENW